MPNNIDEIIGQIQQCLTNGERISKIVNLPDDLKVQVLYHFEDIYIVPSSKLLPSRKTLYNPTHYYDSLYSILRSLPEKQKIEFLASQDDLFKQNYLNDCTNKCHVEDDSVILGLIQSTSDFPYRIVFASKLKDEEIQNKVLKELGVHASFIYYINNLNVKPTSGLIKHPSIGLPDEMSFGIEIECYSRDYATVLRDLKELCTLDFSGKWLCKRDITICADAPIEKDVFPDLEIISNPLTDSTQNIKQIYDVCGFLNDLGFKTNNYCGGHIHFGRNYIETPKQLSNLIRLYGICTDVINLIINEPGSLPKDSMELYAKSTFKLLRSKKFKFNNYTDINECISEIQRLQNGKNFDINISTSNPTYEFRVANSTLNPDACIENIKLFGALMQVAKGLETGYLTNLVHKKKFFSNLKPSKEIHEKCSLLLNLLFDNEEDRAIYRERFEKNYALQFKMQDLKDLCTDRINKSEERNG